MKLLRIWLWRSDVVAVLTLLAVFGLILSGLILRDLVNFDRKIDIAGLTAIPLLLVAVFQLYRQGTVRRANFITGYLSKFYTVKSLNRDFHYLVATYTDSVFQKVEEAISRAQPANSTSAFEAIKVLQNGREEGQRYYHPDHFQGTEEERHLDALLGYLDVIGYHYVRGLVRIEDVAGMLGYQMSLISSRAVITRYLSGTDLHWWRSKPQSQQGATVPYLYLRALLAGFKEYNLKYKTRLEKAFKEAEANWERQKNLPLRG